jgi:hypothetical protein
MSIPVALFPPVSPVSPSQALAIAAAMQMIRTKVTNHAANRLTMIALALVFTLVGVNWSSAWAADPPCDKYPVLLQTKCVSIWKALNQEDGPIIAQFGLDQLKRREEGKITADQHLGENMAFIKQSTEKRLARLKERMDKE